MHPVVALGHSNQEPGRFLESLQAHGVKLLVDIRSFPGSRRVQWAKQDALEALLAEAGIRYLHAPDLGGRRTPNPGSHNTGWRHAAFRGYADYMETQPFRSALDRLIALAQKEPTAIMCAEAVPWRCHRSLVADALTARGVEVVQVLSPTRAEPHQMTKFARVEDGQVRYPAEKPLA